MILKVKEEFIIIFWAEGMMKALQAHPDRFNMRSTTRKFFIILSITNQKHSVAVKHMKIVVPPLENASIYIKKENYDCVVI